MNITIDGITYAVGASSVKRSLRREYKYSVMTEDGVIHTEPRATYMDFELSLGNIGDAAYDSLITALRAASGAVTVTLPSSGTETEVYTGLVQDISDGIAVDYGDGVMWDNLSVSFTGTVPVQAGVA